MPKILLTNHSYDSRMARNRFIAEMFQEFLKASVVNIGGGGEKQLLQHIGPTQYLEIDIAGCPDMLVDLDKDYPLPVQDDFAETVVCTDVLEHLEEFHRVFGELLRISRRYVIISVPNALTDVLPYFSRKIYRGESGCAGQEVGMFAKFYGLPLCKPLDRHRWFFSYTEAESFFRASEKKYNYSVIKEVPIGAKSSSLLGRSGRFIVKHVLGEDLAKDIFCRTYWCVLEKNVCYKTK